MSLTKKDGTIISESIEHADTLPKQIIGLMFREQFEGAMVFDMKRQTYDGIHMLFVRIPIDVVFLDPNKNVVDIKTHLRPWLGSAFPRARFRYAIELPAGAVERSALAIGEQLAW